MINLAELCSIIKRVCTGTMLQCPFKKVLIGNSSNRKKSIILYASDGMLMLK